MRLIYIGQLWQGATGLTRMQALQSLGITCLPFDTTPFTRIGSRIERSALFRLNAGRGLTALNRALMVVAKEAAFDAVWIDKGVFITPETVAALRNAARRRFAVHYTPDAQIVDNTSRHFEKALALYDLAVTTKPFEVDALKAKGAREVLLVLQGYGRQFDGAAYDSALQSDVCFIGHCNRHYAARIKAASTATDGVRVWGPRWPRYARLHAWARPVVQGDGLWGDNYPRALSSTRIALGLLSKAIPETTTTRTFEIPAAGVFLLAERTADHLALFEEGKEAEFFADDRELVDKIRFYLMNDKARQAIAAAGRMRSLKSGYSDDSQLERVVAALARMSGMPLPARSVA